MVKRGRPVLSIPVEDIIADYKSGLSLMDIAGKYSISDMTVYNRLKKAGVETRPRYRQENRRVRSRLKPEDKSQFTADVELYLYDGKNAYEISVYTGISIKDVITEVKRQERRKCLSSTKTQSDKPTNQ